LKDIPLVAVASHDTQSAITAVPAEGKNWAYLSSGTWSLMGIETDVPIVNENSASKNYTNEGSVEGKYCFLKNICGLWILQQCKKSWESIQNYSYEELTQMAGNADHFNAFINTDFEGFYNPIDMPTAISDYCKLTNQKFPDNHAILVRSILESMALKYKLVINELNSFSDNKIEKLFVIGGGARNKLLCQFTSNALDIPVITGPPEASAVGNLLMQAKALGHISSLKEIRDISRNSFESETFFPQETELWNKMYVKYCEILNKEAKE
jgi:rhamnulokinase